jgi:hypothetical protein
MLTTYWTPCIHDGNSGVGNLTIMNANITSVCALTSYGFGAGIGSGWGDYGNSSVGNLTIINGNATSAGSLSGDGADGFLHLVTEGGRFLFKTN